MAKIIFIFGILSSTLLYSACSSSQSSLSNTQNSSPSTISIDLGSVASGLGCVNWYTKESTGVPGIEEWGTCQWKGGRLQIYKVKNQASMGTFFTATSAYGVNKDDVAINGLIIAAPEDPKNLAELHEALN